MQISLICKMGTVVELHNYIPQLKVRRRTNPAGAYRNGGVRRVNHQVKGNRIFPNMAACLRLMRPLGSETHGTWLEDNRHLNTARLADKKGNYRAGAPDRCARWPPLRATARSPASHRADHVSQFSSCCLAESPRHKSPASHLASSKLHEATTPAR
jgi:hypothetical protein